MRRSAIGALLDKLAAAHHHVDMATIDLNAQFAQAESAFRAGRFEQAEALLCDVRAILPEHPRPWHLTALVLEKIGRSEEALVAFSRAAALDPAKAPLLVDFADRLGDNDPERALAILAKALEIEPTQADAYLARGRLLHRLKRFADSRVDLLRVYQLAPERIDGWLARGALELDASMPASAAIAYDRALTISGDNPTALAGRARVALELGESNAAERFAAAVRARPAERNLIMGEAEAREAAGERSPYEAVRMQVAQDPGWAEGQALLGRMLWEDGTPDYDRPLRDALVSQPGNSALHETLIALLAGVDLFDDAADAAAEAARATGDDRFKLAEAGYAGSAGQIDRAEALFAELPRTLPDADIPEARHRIRCGELDRAQALLEPKVEIDPANVPAWALLDVVWRGLGDSRANWLHEQPGLIRQHDLPIDDEAIGEIACYLRGLHNRIRHPVGQSMRGGTQTRGRLLSRQDPLILRLRQVLGEAVMAHWRDLPPADGAHPLLRHRALTPTLSGSWSVRLLDGGHHVSHVHPHGLLSSASYWCVPSGSADGEGWLDVGQPPPDLGLDLPPLASFKPCPGTLVLFPSTLFHATRPFGFGERITVAFDIEAS